MIQIRRISIIIASAGLALGIGAAPAMATSCPGGYSDAQCQQAYTALNALESLSLMTFGDATTSSDIGGRVWVGGTFTSGSAPVNSGAHTNGASTTVNASGFATLTAGSLGSDAQVSNGTNAPKTAVIGNANGHSVTSGVTVTSDATIASQAATYKADAEQLSAILTSLSTATISNFNALSLTSGTYNVFTMSASLFDSQNVDFGSLFSNLSSGTTVIIDITGCNVSGCTMSPGANFNANGKDALLASNLIWNFTDATNVSVNNFFGSILAADATVSNNSGAINGSVMATIFQSQNEIHLGNYTGSEAFIPLQDRVLGAVPEPASWMAMILGFGAMGLILRRERKAGKPLQI